MREKKGGKIMLETKKGRKGRQMEGNSGKKLGICWRERSKENIGEKRRRKMLKRKKEGYAEMGNMNKMLWGKKGKKRRYGTKLDITMTEGRKNIIGRKIKEENT